MDRSVTSLSGIGSVYGGRLNNAGYRSVRDIENKFKSFNYDRNKCEGWLKSTCNANSRYAAMCYEDIRNSREPSYKSSYSPCNQYQSYRSESPTYYEPQRLFTPQQSRRETSYESSYSPFNQSYRSTSPTYYEPQQVYTPQQSPQRSVQQSSASISGSTPVQQSSASASVSKPIQQSSVSISGSGISKTEVMQMMAELKNKQDAMDAQINKLEQEKSRSDQYIKTLESKITIIEKQSVELQKRHDTKIAELTKKLQDMNRVEQYKNISSSIYLLNQKFDDMIEELNEVRQRTKIHSYVKALEKKIELIKINTSKLQKQQDEKFVEVINKMNDTKSFDQHKEVSKNIISLTEKLDEMIKQQNEFTPSTRASLRVDAKLNQIKEDIRNMSIKIRNETKNNTEKKLELTNNQKNLTDIANVTATSKITATKNAAVAQVEIAKLPSLACKDKNGSKCAEPV